MAWRLLLWCQAQPDTPPAPIPKFSSHFLFPCSVLPHFALALLTPPAPPCLAGWGTPIVYSTRAPPSCLQLLYWLYRAAAAGGGAHEAAAL